ncbi:unnamed protein product [Spirodela intermedia]|uniref:Uncharacterized protein n=1 Tax=Spirodela intermedia TaxID=51605 RepID=A0A7I8IZT5_SPIIN|nr:unnamed protein product [Spirodela intermedia]CAA6663103.1 unnamed protein product [Spirodela intermedia]
MFGVHEVPIVFWQSLLPILLHACLLAARPSHGLRGVRFGTQDRPSGCSPAGKELLAQSSIWAADARGFRSDAALHALRRAGAHPGGGGAGVEGSVLTPDNARDENGFSLVLYNYPSFSATLAAVFARRYYSLRRLPALVLPFSSVEPLRVDDLKLQGLRTCYLLDFVGPGRFAVELSRFIPDVVAFDHRKLTAERISRFGSCPGNLELRVDTSKSSARDVYAYFSEKFFESGHPVEESVSFLNQQEERRVESLLEYTEDEDLRRRDLQRSGRSRSGSEKHKLILIASRILMFSSSPGNSRMSSRLDPARKLLGKEFKIRLGRADGHSHLSHEIGDELSRRSAAAGLRPIGAVAFMQRGNLKICLRSTDGATDTAEVAKAYGGGGRSGSSSFIIRMDEYGLWTLPNPL